MTNTKTVITNREDLLAEKKRILDSIKERKASIGTTVTAIKEELNPFSVFTNKKLHTNEGESGISGILQSVGKSPLVSMGIAGAANLLLRKVYLNKAGILPRIFLPLLVKKASEFIVAPKLQHKITSAIHQTAKAIKETDVADIIPDINDTVPEKVIELADKTNKKIADKLHQASDKVRAVTPKQPKHSLPVYGRKNFADKLHQLANKIRS
ncbi:MAG: hypothetical protein ACK5NK_01925 [Niabella sp.]